jgi:hypothetical protein
MVDEEEIVVTDDEPTYLSDYPPMFNTTVVPFFPEIENAPKNIEHEHQSEGGRTIVQRIRTDKLSASVKMSVADKDWVAFFYDLSNGTSAVTFKQYSPLLDDYETRTVRITNFKYKKVKKSECLKAVKGVWEMSFNIEEI